jgi:alkylation response protein AidB-like acyl-CoA dehydrogenase
VDRGFKLGMMALDRLRPTVGAAACGMAARALDEAVMHAATRQQFGQPIGSFQIIREKLGRMATELRAARLLVYHAAWTKDRGADRITIDAAMAKSYATEAAQRIVDEAVQIVGGIGVVVGHPVERLYRSIRALRIYEGATEIQRLIIADALMSAGQSS